MTSSALDIAALDCEMVYTTAGFRIARVSVVDASGECVFDEFIKMDDGVEVVCVHIPIPPS
jgi:RNA exonuclease 1